MSQIGRIGGQVLSDNLLRAGVDLAFETDLLYLDVNNRKIGIKTDVPVYDLDVNSEIRSTNGIATNSATIDNILIQSPNVFTTSVGQINISPSGPNPTAIFDRLSTQYLFFDGNSIQSISNQNIRFDPNGSGTIELESTTNVTGDVYVTGNIDITGNLSKQGNLILGDDVIDGEGSLPENDTVDFNAPFKQNLNPGDDDAYDLGGSLGDSTAGRWRSTVIEDWTNIGTLRPTNAIVSDQIRINGVDNTIYTLQSNDNLSLVPGTDILHVEDVRFYPDYFLKDYATYDVGSSYYRLNVYFNSDGTHLVGVSGRTIYHWDVPVPFDYDSRINETSTTIASLESISFAIVISEPGDRILISGRTSTPRYISEVSLSTAWDLSTAAYVTRMSNGSIGGPTLSYNETGTRLYSIRGAGLINSLTDSEAIYQYNLTTAWRISGGTLQTSSIISVEGNTIGADYSDGFSFPLNPTPGAIWFRNVSFSGNYVYFLIASTYNIYVTDTQYPGDTRDSAKIVKYELTVPGDLSSGGVHVPASDRYTFQQTPGTPITYTLAYHLRLYGDESNEDEQILLESVYLQGRLRMWRREIHNTYIENKDTVSPLTLTSTGAGYYKFDSTNAMVFPAGTNAERPLIPEIGDTRWNTQLGYLECFDGTVYIIATGPGEVIDVQDMEDLGNVYSLILG
jgi:hypothetical protein